MGGLVNTKQRTAQPRSICGDTKHKNALRGFVVVVVVVVVAIKLTRIIKCVVTGQDGLQSLWSKWKNTPRQNNKIKTKSGTSHAYIIAV